LVELKGDPTQKKGTKWKKEGGDQNGNPNKLKLPRNTPLTGEGTHTHNPLKTKSLNRPPI